MHPILHLPQLAGIDEERLAAPVTEAAVGLVVGKKPKADRDLGSPAHSWPLLAVGLGDVTLAGVLATQKDFPDAVTRKLLSAT